MEAAPLPTHPSLQPCWLPWGLLFLDQQRPPASPGTALDNCWVWGVGTSTVSEGSGASAGLRTQIRGVTSCLLSGTARWPLLATPSPACTAKPVSLSPSWSGSHLGAPFPGSGVGVHGWPHLDY